MLARSAAIAIRSAIIDFVARRARRALVPPTAGVPSAWARRAPLAIWKNDMCCRLALRAKFSNISGLFSRGAGDARNFAAQTRPSNGACAARAGQQIFVLPQLALLAFDVHALIVGHHPIPAKCAISVPFPLRVTIGLRAGFARSCGPGPAFRAVDASCLVFIHFVPSRTRDALVCRVITEVVRGTPSARFFVHCFLEKPGRATDAARSIPSRDFESPARCTLVDFARIRKEAVRTGGAY